MLYNQLKGIPKEGVKMLSKIISKPSSNVSLEQAVSILDILLKRNASVTEEFINVCSTLIEKIVVHHNEITF